MRLFTRLLPGFLAALVVLALANSASRAQTQPQGSSAMRMPEELKEYDACLGPQVGDSKKTDKQRDFWRVWADREGVQVFNEETLQTAKAGTTVGFLEPFYVTSVRPDKKAMLLISSKSQPFDPTIVVDRVVGWVKTEHLLLRAFSARTGELIPKRAFIINDFKEFSNDISKETAAQKEVPVRKSPSNGGTREGTWGGTNIFSYVFKYDTCGNHNWFLVGQKTSIKTNRSASEVIIGWVPKSRAVEWDTREAYEPDPRRTTPANIFRTSATEGGANREVLFSDALSREKWAPEKWRYVLLGNAPPSAKEVRIGWVGDLKVVGAAPAAGGGVPALPPDTVERIQKNYDIITNINLIFVVDATTSMGPYLKKTAEAVDKMLAVIQKDVDGSQVKLSYGGVAYRDLADLKASQFEVLKLSKSGAELSRFLRGLQEPKNSPDKDYAEALFEGVLIALRDVAKPNQRNILILLGDAGNQDTKGPLEEMAFKRRIENKFVNMYALHIQRPPRDPDEKLAIDKFERDISRVFTVLTTSHDSALKTAREALPGAPEYKSFVLDRTKPNVEDLDGVAGKIGTEVRKQAQMGQMMAAAFVKCIDRGFAECMAESKPDAKPTVDGGPSDYEVKAAMLDIIAQSSGVDPALFRAMVAKKVQLFTPGWIATGGMRPMYLVQQIDLALGMRTLSEFQEAGNADGAHLVAFFKDMVETLTGHRPENKQNPGEYIAMNSGLRFKGLSNFLNKSYDELANASPADIRKFVDAAKTAEDKLRALYDNDNIWFRNYGEKYAWIAAEDLP